MKKIHLIAFFIIAHGCTYAQVYENIYSAYSIPKDLLENANAVVRRHDISYTVISLNNAVEKEHKIVTILNEKAKNHATPYFFYDKMNFIENIEANFYDANGKLVRKIKKKDIKDFMPYQEFVEDNRYKVIDFPHLPYPYTVEYTVEKESKQTMFYPNFMPQEDNNDAVENATMTITLAEGMTLNYKEINMPNKGVYAGNTYKWWIDKVKAFQHEPFSPYVMRYLPRVLLAPNDFEIAGYKGKADTWANLGAFEYKLNKDRQVLTPEVKAKVLKLVEGCTNDSCKIEKLYEYLQNTTRYFSIQLGIGGWQTISATDVEKAKYGDCKGLSNYMVAMLDVVGIKAHHVLISRDANAPNKEVMQRDFPMVTFNHMMACVPMGKDTMWLECTNQTTAAGYLESSDEDRDCLVITPEGGKVAHTTKTNEKVNIAKREVIIDLNTEGGATVTSKTQYNGLTQDFYLIYLEQMNDDDKKKMMYEKLKINNADIKEMTFGKVKKPTPLVNENLTLDVKNMASVSGKRLFLPYNLFSKWTKVPSGDSTRQFEVQAHDRGFTEDEIISINMPLGYSLETKINPLSIETPFGKYELSLRVEDNKMVIYRKLVLNNIVHPKESFPKLVEFLKTVAKHDNTKLVLVKTI